MTLPPPSDFCQCGCGTRIANPEIMVNNVWHRTDPYWAWMCPNAGCDRHLVECKNQSGDPVCPWCGSRRRLIGHFCGEQSHSSVYRITVTGKRVNRPPQPHTHYWQPFQLPGAPYG